MTLVQNTGQQRLPEKEENSDWVRHCIPETTQCRPECSQSNGIICNNEDYSRR